MLRRPVVTRSDSFRDRVAFTASEVTYGGIEMCVLAYYYYYYYYLKLVVTILVCVKLVINLYYSDVQLRTKLLQEVVYYTPWTGVGLPDH